MLETDLYPPVKAFLERQGYEVKSEVKSCDVVAVRGNEAPVIVELKTKLSLPLILQGIDRQSVTDAVYIAIGPLRGSRRTSLWGRHRKRILGLCRRLGLGLLSVEGTSDRTRRVEVHLDPLPYQPRKNNRRTSMLLGEFEHRAGDLNTGGSSRRPLITAYRQDALRCVKFLEGTGQAKLADIRCGAAVERASGILQKDVYGWFQRVERGIYTLSPKGTAAAGQFRDVINRL
ncbi:MAG: DUF2161 family putative PD-(D/E)XK-type phosphodiesterase [Pseudomonadota bacterium]